MHGDTQTHTYRSTWARTARLAAAGSILAMFLGACASTSDLPAREAALVAPVDAMIIPPPGGPAILKVVSKSFPNAIQQEIYLATQARTPGENKISLIQFEGKGGDGSDPRLRDVPFSQVNLTEEAQAAWPDTGMAVSPYYVQNDYGPFGYAVGRPANGDACVYAWQRISPQLKPSGAIARGAIVVRLQLCKQGAGEQELLEVMYRLRLNSSVFPPAAAPAAIGRIRAPIRPVGAQGFADVIELPKPAAAPARPSAPAKPAPPAQVTPVAASPVAPPAGAPIVPSPGPANGGGTGPLVPPPPASDVVVPTPSSGTTR